MESSSASHGQIWRSVSTSGTRQQRFPCEWTGIILFGDLYWNINSVTLCVCNRRLPDVKGVHQQNAAPPSVLGGPTNVVRGYAGQSAATALLQQQTAIQQTMAGKTALCRLCTGMSRVTSYLDTQLTKRGTTACCLFCLLAQSSVSHRMQSDIIHALYES